MKQLLKFKKWCELVGLDIKEHQLSGFEWCNSHEVDNRPLKGGLLCDEMGLGKTVLMLGCIVTNPLNRTLIVVPPALIIQWEKCIEKFLLFDVFVFHGAAAKIPIEELLKHKIVLTTYGMIAKRSQEYISPLWNIQWDRLICDEAHHLRNAKTKICRGASRIQADIKWMVTGTPIQNKTNDIKVLFTILGKLIYGRTELLEHINEYVLRRTKKGVGINLPTIENENIIVEWESKKEENLAASIHTALDFSGVSLDTVNDIMGQLNYDSPLPLFVRARQVCIDSNLLKPCILKLQRSGLIPPDFQMTKITTTSKLTAVINKVLSEPKNVKKIIFSFYKKEIDTLAERLRAKSYSVGILDGRTKKKERRDLQEPTFSQPDVLIIQIQSGSEGLNLQHFSQVYFTSPHWNPGVEDQSIARVHRIGQTKPVQVFRFQMAPFHNGLTLENYCIEVQENKRKLMKLVDQ